ncbi:hypothetical protein [Chryseobacterium balustinum]|uniref:Uncharacterized protein n=1 Tax=Chryseobacterium balustinum TaxID=246 RepID=A0AAX2IJ67_9FLAO|nr:hypothetical protein [Chryseobacterium balustinum]AZB30715.1 hypothetical protein EB354_16485 [Chryseobacterium balustinum]SKB98523.1 hypothetical protein SAMN05421800_11843 [Chryseobacterium balustinum]SQA88854.1 Uncharacterised protein [Chryseobacterium balustinum]
MNPKKATQAQLEKLKELRTQLISPSIDIRIGILVHIDQILKDIDFISSFHSNLSTDLVIYKMQREKFNFDSIVQTVNHAINYYEELK